jgi:regulation of enolase protein 1 (concanavalin A-like superfamily)
MPAQAGRIRWHETAPSAVAIRGRKQPVLALCIGPGVTSMASSSLYESFAGATLHPDLRWFCEPRRWAILAAQQRLRVEPDGATDFWQRTHSGLRADNGHLLFAPISGDFVMATRVAFRPCRQYDQAGLMARVSAACWIKTSVEYEPTGPSRLGVVVTNHGYSDWSTQDFPPGPAEVWLRLRREDGDYLVDAALDGVNWQQMRLAHLHEDAGGAAVDCGLYACSPMGAGFVAEFAYLSIEPGRLSVA